MRPRLKIGDFFPSECFIFPQVNRGKAVGKMPASRIAAETGISMNVTLTE
jgi:hypothetical protein